MIITKPRARPLSKPGFPQLVALNDGSNIALDKPIILIGRHQECDIQIPSRKISRRHCCIALISDHLVVRDLGSTNGIRINGVKVVEGNLQPNDELTIGNMRYQVNWLSVTPAHAKGMHIKPGLPEPAVNPSAEESFEVPMPLPDVAIAHPVLHGEPKAPPPEPVKPNALEIPDSVHLAPIDPNPSSSEN